MGNVQLLKPVMPREHGAWGMWIIPYLSTLIYFKSISLLSFLFFVIFFLGFVSRIPASNLLLKSKQLNPEDYGRNVFWLACYVGGIIFLLAILWQGGFLISRQMTETVTSWLVLASILFLIQLILEYFHWIRSVAGEILAVVGLSLAVPVAAASVGHHFSDGVFNLWCFQVAYFAGPVFYVKMKLAGIKFQKIGTPVDKAKMGTFNLGYYSLMAFALLAGSYFHLIKDTVLIAFAPVIIRAFEGTINLAPNTKLKSVGWKEVLYSIWFGIWIAF